MNRGSFHGMGSYGTPVPIQSISPRRRFHPPCPPVIPSPPRRSSTCPLHLTHLLLLCFSQDALHLHASDLWIFIKFPLGVLFALFSYEEKV